MEPTQLEDTVKWHLYELTELIHDFHKKNQKIWSMFHVSMNDEFLIFQAKKELNMFTEQDMKKEHYRRWMNFS